MGETLANVFKGSSTLDKVAQGGTKGVAQGVGQAMTPQPTTPGGGASGMAPAPSAAPVDPRFFMPSTFGGQGGQPQSPLYG